MKKGIIIALLSLWCGLLSAQTTDTIFYDADWKEVSTRDSAEYFRLFDRYDAATELYHFKDYYITGQLQSTCSYKDKKGKSNKEGYYTYYYKNGNVSKKGNYLCSFMEGDWYFYFEDGTLKSETSYKVNCDKKDVVVSFWKCYDAITREQTLKDGEGIYVSYADDSTLLIKGSVTNSKKHGTWTGYYDDGRLHYTEEYKNGDFKSGISYNKQGKKYTYKVVEEMPEYKGGQAGLMKYMASVEYPQKALEKDLSGKVYVQFVVDKDGSIIDVSIARSSGHKILDNAAMQHVAAMKKWKPGLQRGQPVKVHYVIPLAFKLT